MQLHDEPNVRQRMAEHMDRVAREEAEWHAARLHHAIHGTWLGPDECPTCRRDEDALDVEQAH